MIEEQLIAEDDARPDVEQEVVVDEQDQAEQPDQPEKKPEGVPIAKFVQTKKEKQELQKRLDEQERQLQALRQQSELYRLSAGKPEAEPVSYPSPDDYYDDPEGFKAAVSRYETHLTKRAMEEAQKLIDNKFQSLEQQENVKKAQEAQQASINAHYERAQALNAPDFVEVEERVREHIDDELYTLVTGYFDNSEQVIYALGGDVDKAEEFQAAIKADPIRGFQKLIRFADSLSNKQSNKQLPEPDEPPKGGLSGVANVEARIEKMREQTRIGKMTMNEFLAKKRELLGQNK